MDHEYGKMLAALGNTLGMPGLTFEDDCCDLLVDGRYSLNIRKDADADRIVLTGVVADELPDPVDYSLVLDLLDHALSPVFSAGPAVGRDPETGVLVAYVVLPMRQLDEASFPVAVQRFLEFQLLMAERLRLAANSAPSGDEPVAPGSMLSV